MNNILKIVSISELIHTDFIGRPLERLKKKDAEGNYILEPNPCKEFGFARTGSEIREGVDANGDKTIIKLSTKVSSSMTVYRKLYKRDYEHMFHVQPGVFCNGVIYFNVPCEPYNTLEDIRRNRYSSNTVNYECDKIAVVALQDEDLLTALKNSGRRPLAGYDYNCHSIENKQIEKEQIEYLKIKLILNTRNELDCIFTTMKKPFVNEGYSFMEYHKLLDEYKNSYNPAILGERLERELFKKYNSAKGILPVITMSARDTELYVIESKICQYPDGQHYTQFFLKSKAEVALLELAAELLKSNKHESSN